MSERRAIFLGSKAFGLAVLRVLMEADPSVSWSVLHPADDQDARSARAAFETYCAERALPLTVTARSKQAYEIIAAEAPDIVFVCGWYFLIPPETLSAGPRFFGIHNSLLPKYRGGSPLVWAMIRGDRVVGSTLFGFTPGMDDGPVYKQVSIEPDGQEGIGDLLARLEQSWLEALPGTWPAVVSGTVSGSVQDESAATYCGLRRPEDGEIDWRQDAQSIHDFVRAQARPYPGAFTQGTNGPIHVWRTKLFGAPYHGTPGQLLERRPGEAIVACGNGTAISILEASDQAGREDLATLFPSLSVRLDRRG
jgi:methionyl-tRNA formyltransferase